MTTQVMRFNGRTESNTCLQALQLHGLPIVTKAFITHLVNIIRGMTSIPANDYSIAFVTCPNETVAEKIASGLVENKYAACVHVIPNIKSFYMLEGKVEKDSELLLKIKTRTSRMADITSYVKENHPYTVADVISCQIDQGNPPYLEWILETVPKPDTR